MKNPISVPEWMKREMPATSEFCEIINDSLAVFPDMTLAEFAEKINQKNKDLTYERIINAERRQFGGIGHG